MISTARQIATRLLEADEDFDHKGYIMSHTPHLPPRPKDVKFYLWVEPEDHWPPGWDVGDEAENERILERIRRRLDHGDDWAYGIAIVVAKYTDPHTLDEYYGNDNLGGCNYANRNDFMKNSGYFEDMKSKAFNELLMNFKQCKTGPGYFDPPEGSEVPKQYSQFEP